MFDLDIALEALGVVCNATVTSVRKQSSETSSDSDLQAASSAFQQLSLSGSAAPTRLSLNQLISVVVDGDQTCPVSRSNFFRIHSILSGEEPPANSVSFHGNQSGTGSFVQGRCVSKFQVNDKNGKFFIIDEDEFFDPSYNYDFTGLTDTDTVYYRGDEVYKRPCGWQRFALKVLDKYDGNEWLGTLGRSTQSVPGEWPVSYHGTSHRCAEGIIKGFYKPGPGRVYGTGVYSTPDIEEAEKNYCKEFKATKNGKRYKVILQNRINPKYRKICDKKIYWLVEIDDKLPNEEKKKLAERAIRPYGLLLKEF